MTELSESLSLFISGSSEPVFSAPWEAHAFALAVKLHEKGLYSWSEWSQYLSRVIHDHDSHSSHTYYEHWLQALENLLVDKGVVDAKEILQEIQILQMQTQQPEH